MSRLDKERESKLQPKRIDKAVFELENLGIEITSKDDTQIHFEWNNSTITFYPYSGWHTGKSIKDGRGLKALLKQLK